MKRRLFYFVIFLAVGCTRAKGPSGNAEPIEGRIGGPDTLSIREFIARFPSQASNEEAFCRTVAPTLDAAAMLRNPSLPYETPDFDFLVQVEDGKRQSRLITKTNPPEVRDGVHTQQTIYSLFERPQLGYQSESLLTSREGLAVAIDYTATVFDGYAFGLLFISTGDKVTWRNVLCRFQLPAGTDRPTLAPIQNAYPPETISEEEFLGLQSQYLSPHSFGKAIQGKWMSACVKETPSNEGEWTEHTREEWVIENPSLESSVISVDMIIHSYADSACTQEKGLHTTKLIVGLREQSITEPNAMTFTIDAFFMDLQLLTWSPQVAFMLNLSRLCDYGGWTVGQAKSLSGKICGSTYFPEPRTRISSPESRLLLTSAGELVHDGVVLQRIGATQ